MTKIHVTLLIIAALLLGGYFGRVSTPATTPARWELVYPGSEALPFRINRVTGQTDVLIPSAHTWVTIKEPGQ
jgi:hypothetical protein